MQYTSDVNEYAYTAALDNASDRVRVVEIGRTVLGEPINMFIIGYPTPPRNVRRSRLDGGADQLQRARQRAVVARACLIMARELAFADDPRTLDILSTRPC